MVVILIGHLGPLVLVPAEALQWQQDIAIIQYRKMAAVIVPHLDLHEEQGNATKVIVLVREFLW